MNIDNFRVVGTALITPFRKDGSIDFTALKNMVNFQIENGVSYIVALGTTSEAATMSKDEQTAVVDFIIEENNGRVPVVVGCGGNNTAEVVKQLDELNKPGVDAILTVVPYYNKPNQNGIYEHFKAIANATKLPIILYNVPGRTGMNMTASTTLRLANGFDNIIGVKDASGNFAQADQMLRQKPANFLVLSGDDALSLPLIACGFDGVISVVSNAFPKEFSSMVEFALSEKVSEARILHYQMVDIIDSLFVEGNPAGVKAFLTNKGLIENNLRLPLVPVSKALAKLIKSQMI